MIMFNSGMIIRVRVKPGMPKAEITGFDREKQAYKMNVRAVPERGRANLEIIRFFRKRFGKDAKIISGASSRMKLLKIA
ncbi:YggU family protein [Candidatus Woesearchaeota archaeon]|nr:YggU family protein [Candidatus Woesearchaeota archaeon]